MFRFGGFSKCFLTYRPNLEFGIARRRNKNFTGTRTILCFNFPDRFGENEHDTCYRIRFALKLSGTHLDDHPGRKRWKIGVF